MSAFHKSCVLACLLAVGCASAEGGADKPFNGSNGDTDTDKDPVEGTDAGNGSSGDQNAGQNMPGGKDAGTTGGPKDAGTKSDAGTKTDSGTETDAGTKIDCMGKAGPGVDGKLPSFKRETLSTQTGAAYMHPVDLNKDNYSEYLLTTLSEGIDLFGGIPPLDFGGAYILRREGGAAKGVIGKWQTQKAFGTEERIGCPNSSEYFDVDGDSVKDWVIGAGFLLKTTGKVVWMKGTAAGAFGKPQTIIEPADKCWYHITLPLDMDGDSDNDFVTSCHIGDVNTAATGASRVEWFENDGKGKFKLHAIGAGGGSLLSLHDLDGDGDQDVIAPQFFGPESMVWYEQTGAKGATWAKHIINNTTGRGFIVKFADMNGDGKVDMLYGNHNNEEAAAAINRVMGLYWFDLPETDKVRTLANWDAYKHTIYEGFVVDGANNDNQAGAPGMINVGDIDGDCDMDVTASGDGDLGLYAFIQQKDKFERVELYKDPSNANSGEQHLADLDADGDMDVIWAVFGASSGLLSSHVYGFLQN